MYFYLESGIRIQMQQGELCYISLKVREILISLCSRISQILLPQPQFYNLLALQHYITGAITCLITGQKHVNWRSSTCSATNFKLYVFV